MDFNMKMDISEEAVPESSALRDQEDVNIFTYFDDSGPLNSHTDSAFVDYGHGSGNRMGTSDAPGISVNYTEMENVLNNWDLIDSSDQEDDGQNSALDEQDAPAITNSSSESSRLKPQDAFSCDQENVNSDSIKCVICLDILNDKEVVKIACKHTFHSNCLRTWLKTTKSCPTCRSRLYDPSQKETFRLILHRDAGVATGTHCITVRTVVTSNTGEVSMYERVHPRVGKEEYDI